MCRFKYIIRDFSNKLKTIAQCHLSKHKMRTTHVLDAAYTNINVVIKINKKLKTLGFRAGGSALEVVLVSRATHEHGAQLLQTGQNEVEEKRKLAYLDKSVEKMQFTV